MSIKLLGGEARGFSLDVPAGDLIRPTQVLLKRRLFDAHQFWDGKIMADVCAGSGSIGLEALSRGADEIFLNEKEKKVFHVLKNNISHIVAKYPDYQSKIKTSHRDALDWLNDFKSQYLLWDKTRQERVVIFLDPPYEMHHLYQKFVQEGLLGEEKWFIGELWIESDTQKGLPESYWEQFLTAKKIYRQGTSYLFIAQL